ncbi:MAG: hypothetical protein WEC59_12015 [Salibacteraceae bacterium]
MRYAALPFIFAALIVALLAGLHRAGFNIIGISNMAGYHGALMTGSFLGALISLERAIVVKKRYAYLVPISAALSLPMFYVSPDLGYGLLVASSAGLVAIMIWLYYKYNEWHQIIFIVGAACWLIGNFSILVGDFYFFAAPWWMLFFLFVITAERIELAKFILIKLKSIALITAFLTTAFASMLLPFHSGGKEILGLGFIGVSITLLLHDIARKNIKVRGIHGFSGVAMILGYMWLFVSGVGMTFLRYSGLFYDAILHTFFIGFVFSMIFAYGPIILPTILKKGISVFHPILYIWLVALHLGLLIRVVADLSAHTSGRLVASWIDAISMLCFFLTIGILVIQKGFNKKTSSSK